MDGIIPLKELILSSSQRKYQYIFDEGIRLKQNNKLKDAMEKFYICASIDSTQFILYREIFQIMVQLKYDYLECFSLLLKPLNHDSRDSIPQQIEYLQKYLQNNKNKEIIDAVKQFFVKNKQKSTILSDNIAALIKEKNFITAIQYVDLYEYCVIHKNIQFQNSCLIFMCKSIFNQEEGLVYILNQQRGCFDFNKTKQVLSVLIKSEFLLESLNIILFLQNRFKNLNFISVLELKLKECNQHDNEYLRRNQQDIIKIYEIMIKKFPIRHKLKRNLSLLLFQIDHDLAYSYSKQYLEFSPQDYQFHFDLGQIYNSKNDKIQAIFHFEKIIEIYIREVNKFFLHLSDIYFNLGECYFELKQFKKAVYCYQKYKLTLKRGKFFHISSIASIDSLLANCYQNLNQYEQLLDILPKS